MITLFYLWIILASSAHPNVQEINLKQPICKKIKIIATINIDNRNIEGFIRCVTTYDGDVKVIAYPNILSSDQNLKEYKYAWHYPKGFSPAFMKIKRKYINYYQDDKKKQIKNTIFENLGKIQKNSILEIFFKTKIPIRKGLFGVDGESVFLLGGWHPIFGEQSIAYKQKIDYSIDIPNNYIGFIGHTPIQRKPTTQTLKGSFYGRFLPLLLAYDIELKKTKGAIILAPKSQTPFYSKPSTLKNLFRESPSINNNLVNTLKEGYFFAKKEQFFDTPIIVVQAPIREYLVESFDGGIAVSQESFHLPNIEKFKKFHRSPILFNQIKLFLEKKNNPIYSEEEIEMMAWYLKNKFLKQKYNTIEYAGDFLKYFAIIPEIDALIFDPKTPFLDAYYKNIYSSSPHKQFNNFYHKGVSSIFLYQKLIDILGQSNLEKYIKSCIQENKTSLISCIDKKTSLNIKVLLNYKFIEYPHLDYKLGHILSHKNTLDIHIEAQGPDKNKIIEPLVVEIVDSKSIKYRKKRIGIGKITFKDIDMPLKSIVLDPDMRLIELYNESGKNSRFNNYSHSKWKFLLNDIYGQISLSNKTIIGGAYFTLKRVYDLRYSFNFSTFYSLNSFGGTTSIRYAFGSKRTSNSLKESISFIGEYERFYKELEESLSSNKNKLSIALSYRYDNRNNIYSSFKGKGLRLKISTGYYKSFFTTIGGALFKIFRITQNHAILSYLRYDKQFLYIPKENQLQLGGRYIAARGFEYNEETAQTRIIKSIEYRHVIDAYVRFNLFGLFTLTRIDGALFADAVYLPVNRMDCQKNYFYDIGYGIRFIGDILSISPGSLQLDFGLPINRCLSNKHKFPLSIYLSFIQSFAFF